MTLKKYFGS